MAQFTFVRHGNTTKAERDEDRVLTEAGKDQAREFRAIVKRNGLAPFDLVLTSPATRAKQTGAIIAPWGVDTSVLPELGVEIAGEDGVRLNEVYGRLKYAPLTEYLNEPDMSGILSRYANAACAAIEAAVSRVRNAERVLIVGHAVMLNAIGARWTKDDVVQDMRLSPLASVSLGECEGFVIKENGPAELIRRD